MIAPLRPPLKPTRTDRERRSLQRVRRMIASTLLKPHAEETAAKPVPAWQAWLLAVWMLATASTYLAIMLGSWK